MDGTKKKLLMVALLAYTGLAFPQTQPPANPARRVILFVWDGLRPDSITQKITPNLYRLKQQGTWFNDHHSSYPSFTMMNAASIATGDLPGKTGFFGNMLWDPRALGADAEGIAIDFRAPVFTEDYQILKDMNRPQKGDPVLFTPTLFSLAHQAGISTAAVGKSGPAFMQNYSEEDADKSVVFDEKHVYPLKFAKDLAETGYALPKMAPHAYAKGKLNLSIDNGDPTWFRKVATLKVISGGALGIEDDFMLPDNVTPDPSATDRSPYSDSNRYLMKTYLTKILAQRNPKLSVIWLRNPDTTEHNYGVGSASYFTALRDQDAELGKLLTTLKNRGLLANTDLLITSDHGHSNVSGPTQEFPLRFIHNGMVSVPDPHGFSASGDFRPADLLTRAGFHAYDGEGCKYDPVLSGIKANGSLTYPIKVDKNGSVCGNKNVGHFYTTPSYQIPSPLPQDAIIVANNGGSSYLYLVNHEPALLKKVTRYLQSRQEFGVVFVDDHYGNIAGTFPMSTVHMENTEGRNPDIIVSSNADDHVSVRGFKGIEFNSGGISRGMHGSFSRTDIHNTLIAIGPDFKTGFIDTLPSGSVDIAPTIAYLLKFELPNSDGRPLLEALKGGDALSAYSVIRVRSQPDLPASGLNYQLATDPDGHDIDSGKTHYTIKLDSKVLLVGTRRYVYFDRAFAWRY